MKEKWVSILISSLLIIGCLTGCNNGDATSSRTEGNFPSSITTDTSSSESENSGEEASAPVFDFESRTVMLNSGYEMPIAGLGTYALSDEECYNSVTALLEAGGRLIDTASYYGNEEAVGRAVRELQSVLSLEDEELSALASQLSDVDGLLNDFNRELSDYLTSLEFDEREFAETEERLNQLNYLKSRYGHTIGEILAYQQKQQERLAALQDYDRYLQELEERLCQAERELGELCERASEIRKRFAEVLCGKIREHLQDLNFLNVEFEMSFEELPEYTAQGRDSAEFLISTNPGEPLRPLMKIASGGELSRIMLAIKTVLADRDEIDVVIFDEIDVGISGRTAQKVSEKMMLIGRTRQVICITHLAQIAAMADSHYRIEKTVEDGGTRTQIRRLDERESVEELARILGGAEITDAVLQNAGEMRTLAQEKKQSAAARS